MKKVLKFLKWLGLSILGLVLIVAIYLSITGLPKPFAITTENVPRVPFSYASNIFNTYQEYMMGSGSFALLDWVPDQDEALYVRHSGGIGILHKPDSTPQLMDDWPKYRPIFHPDADKRYFLYTEDNSSGKETYQIYKYDLDTKESSLITNGKDDHSYPRFIPGCDKIIYTKKAKNETDRTLYLKDLNNPDSERMLFRASSEFYGNGHIYIDDFSPDGTKVILRLNYFSPTPAILDIETGELKLLVKEDAPKANYTYHEWSTDGKRLYYASSINADFGQLRVRELETGIDSVLVKNINWDVSNVTESPDGNWIIFSTNEDGVGKLNFHHIPSGKTERFDQLTSGNIRGALFNPNANATIAFGLTYFSGETDIFSYNIETKELKQWTHNKKADRTFNLEAIRYPTFDFDSVSGQQREIAAVYFKPDSTFEAPYPVIVELHGGPNMQVTTEYNPFVQFELDRGIAVIAPNFRGSRGYGFNFMNMDYGKGREGAIRDVGALLDWIEEQPELDANRVIISGGSYGGYLSLISASRYSDRILGAVDFIGMTDLVPFLEGEKNADRTGEYGDPSDPEMRAFLNGISPIHNVSSIDVPLFIFHGEQDTRVLVDQPRKMVEALEKNNKTYRYIEASDEGHNPTKPWNIIYVMSAQMSFVDELFFDEK
jgi:dipeptidyl aminopeptidase/acylaminoacyl peptidase